MWTALILSVLSLLLYVFQITFMSQIKFIDGITIVVDYHYYHYYHYYKNITTQNGGVETGIGYV